MPKLINLILGDKCYSMERKKAMSIMKMAKEENKGKNVIVGLERHNILECRLDYFPKADELLSATQEWIKQGYKVHYRVQSLKGL